MSVRPFDSGSQYADWTERNCMGCALYNAEEYDGACEIDGELGAAYMGNGQVSDEIAGRMGYKEGHFSWPCPERVPR